MSKGGSKKPRKPRQVVQMHDDFPALCPKCGSNELKDAHNVREKEEWFERAGIVYTHAKRFYAKCAGCGQTRAICRRLRKSINSNPQGGKQA